MACDVSPVAMFLNIKSFQEFGRLDTNPSPVPLFVAKIAVYV